jgi:hypothetical protein
LGRSAGGTVEQPQSSAAVRMTQGRTEYSIADRGIEGRAARINHAAADIPFARTNPALPPLVT